MIKSVLIVEDDADIAELIRVNLTEPSLEIHHCSDGAEGLSKALSEQFDLLILDVMLPSLSGLEICRQIRESKPSQAIIILTSKSSEIDRVVGLEIGADDYMTKPFSIRELQARVRTQLRRAQLFNDVSHHDLSLDSDDVIVEIGQLKINSSTHEVYWGKHYLDLTSTEFDLLLYFAQHPNQVFSRSQLLDAVWGYQHSGYEHTVNSHINRLRNKLEADSSRPMVVQTVWGVGYKLNAEACC